VGAASPAGDAVASPKSGICDTTQDSWLLFIGYFLSFIPSMLTLIIFVLPSEFYKEYHKSIAQYRTVIQRHIFRISH
jgi:hypothetical protein